MKLFKVKGIVIKEIQYKDNDKIITLLTDEFGKISCLAKGAKKNNSPLLAACQLFVYSEFVLYKGTSFYHINSAETIDTFYNLRSSLDKIDMACEVTTILNRFIYEEQESTEILSLYLNTLFVIAKKNLDYSFVISVFKLKLLKVSGFLPSFAICGNCKKKLIGEEIKQNKYVYSKSLNHVICDECKSKEDTIMILNEAVFYAVNFVATESMKRIFMFELKDEAQKEFKTFVDNIFLEVQY